MTIHAAPRAHDPLAALQLDAATLASPAAQRARLAGLLEAKAEAHRSAARLARWARPLAVAVVLTSGLHIWETLAAVAPARVEALALPAWLYHLSALLLVLMIDSSLVFLAAASSAAAYAGHAHRPAALPVLYTATALLNGAYLVRYMPGLPPVLREPVLMALAVVFVLLLALLIPVVLVAIERAAHVLQAARLALGVEVATLRGLVEAEAPARPGATPAPTAAPPTWAGPVLLAAPSATLPRQASYPPPVAVASTAHNTPSTPSAQVAPMPCAAPAVPRAPAEALTDPTQGSTEASEAPRYACPSCGATLTLGAYGSAKRRGYCRSCKPS